MTNLTTVGHWALIVGIVLAVIAGFTTIPSLTVILFVLGLVIGFLNIRDKESTPFLVAVIALLLIGVAGLQLGRLTVLVASVIENFIALVGAAGLVVAVKEVVTLARV